MVDVYERALMIRARIAALRHYLLQNTTNHAVEDLSGMWQEFNDLQLLLRTIEVELHKK